MAKIPLYEQNRLASSVVGTPGVGTSAAQVLNGISQGAEQLQYQLALSARQNALAAAQQQQQQQKLAAAQKKVLDEIEIADHDVNIGLAHDNEESRIKAEMIGDPSGASRAFADTARANLDEYLNSIQDPEIRNKVKVNGLKAIHSRATQIGNWELTQRTENAKGKIENTLGELVNSSKSLGSISDVGRQWERVEQLRPALMMSHGADADKIAQKTKTDIVKSYVNGLMLKDPSLAESAVNSGAFDSALDGEDKQNLVYRARMLAKAAQRDEMHEAKIESIQRRVELADIVINTDDTDLEKLKAAQQETAARVEMIKAQPADKVSLDELNDAISKQKQIQTKIENFGKSSKKIDLQNKWDTYNSSNGVKARESIRSSRAAIEANLKAGAYSKDKAVEKLNKWLVNLDKARELGYLDTPESKTQATWERHKAWAAGKLATLSNKKQAPITAIMDGVSGFVDDAMKFFNDKPSPKSGGNKAKDAATSVYEDTLNTYVGQYMRLNNGKEPSAAMMKKFDARAKQVAQQKVYHGK